MIHNADYIIYKPLELKGNQKKYFLKKLEEFDPTLIEKYTDLYKESILPGKNYLKETKEKIEDLCKTFGISSKIKG